MPRVNKRFEQVRIAPDVKPLLKKACKANFRTAPAEVNAVLRKEYTKGLFGMKSKKSFHGVLDAID